jgi:hypothetical protein
MSAQAALLQRLRAARARRAWTDALTWMPWVLVTAALGWRVGGGALAAPLLVAGCAALALWSRRRLQRLDRAWLVRQMDTQRADLEDSSGLLFADIATLNPLQHLQRARLQQRLQATPPGDLRTPWPVPRLVAAWIVAAVAMALLAYRPAVPATAPALAPVAQEGKVAPGVPRLVGQRLRVTPPAYTGLPARDEDVLDAKAPQGSRLQWTLAFAPQPASVALVFLDGERVELERDGDRWTTTRPLDASVLYRVVAAGAPEQPAAKLHRLDAIADAPPRIRVLAPAQGLTLSTPGQRSWPLQFEVTDDYGVAASAQLRITLAQGEGENITFREQSKSVTGRGVARTRRFDVALDLSELGFAQGDDLIALLEVGDNRRPSPQRARSPSLILRWPPDAGEQASGLDGMVKKVLPAYFRSQRQIIIDAEALLKQKPRLNADTFVTRSDAIGVDQRLLRLRYGQFLGEESEGVNTLPTNDAQESTPSGEQAPAEETHSMDDGHGHSEADFARPGGFGSAVAVLEEYGHTHDESEAATLLDPDTRATLKLALDQMWQSELHLRQGDPKQALPFAYKALEFIKQVQQSTRIYLARVGPELPPIDLSRRLSGKREGLANRALPPLAGDHTPEPPAVLWQALGARSAVSPQALAAPIESLQRWLRDNAARVPDPLAISAAVDAVQRDSACEACRESLRALLWTAMARPPASVQRREPAGAVGARYLESLRREDAP